MRIHPALAGVLLATLTSPLQAQDTRAWGDELGAAPRPERLIPVAPRPREAVNWPAPPLRKPPAQVRAIYVNAWAFGGSRFYDLLRLADTTEINAFVVDVKDDTGYLTYRSSVPTAVQIGANTQLRAPDAAARIRTMIAHGIHPVARIVVAKDPLLARNKTSWSIRDRRGGLWKDRLDLAWVDAFNDSIWVYAAQLAAEAVRMGFAEVQFDYVRFPDEPKARMSQAVFPSRKPGQSTRDGVRENLTLLRDRIKPLGVPFTLDVFGMTTNVEIDMGIGQVWEDLVTAADVVLPMVYPSHYYNAIYGVGHPNSEPYRIVRSALEDGLRRNARMGGSPATIRPYLQAFTLGRPRYTPDFIREQIRAARDVGIDSWVLWNARAAYDPRIFDKTASTSLTRAAAPSYQGRRLSHKASSH